jgi:transcriptional regulator with XRE-family HTH domain
VGNNGVMLLKEYLAETGETIDQFASRVGESPHTIGKLYRGERFPRVDLAQRIRAATKGQVTADDLLAAAEAHRAAKAA